MYTIDIHHKGDDKPTSYVVFREEEANEKIYNTNTGKMQKKENTDSPMMAMWLRSSVSPPINLLAFILGIHLVIPFIILVIIVSSLKLVVGSLMQLLVVKPIGKFFQKVKK